MKTGLVMEGGAMRGMFTCGVTDVMMEHGIRFDGAIGVSAGAAFGCNVKSGQIGRAIRYNKRFCRDSHFGSFRSFLRCGDLYDAEFCYRKIPYELDLFDTKAYHDNPMEFYVTCTDVESGRPVYRLCMDGSDGDIQWMRASASMPIVSRVVELDGYRLLDGGISDSIPIRYFEELGYDRNVVILTQPLSYRKQPLRYGRVLRLLLRRYPNVAAAMLGRHVFYNQTLDYIRAKEEKGELLAIRPPEPLRIGSMSSDASELERVYQIGRAVGAERLEDLRQFLKGNSGIDGWEDRDGTDDRGADRTDSGQLSEV